MLQNYLKTLIRTFKKNRLATAINIIGLTVAFACAILLLLRVRFEFSFDNFYPDQGRLYKVYSFSNQPEGKVYSASMPYPIEAAVKKENIGVEQASLFIWGGRAIRYEKKEMSQNVRLVGTDFINLFSLPVVAGNRQTPLGSSNDLVLTAAAAKRIFGTEDPVGKKMEVNIWDKWVTLTVSAVVKDLPKNSSLDFDLLASYQLHPDYAEVKNKWNWTSADLYVKLTPGANVADFEKRLQYIALRNGMSDTAYARKSGFFKDANGNYVGMGALPVKELHFNSEMGSNNAVSKPFLFVLILIASVMLLIACFNFVNLNIGVSLTRTKEIGVRKCLGAQKRQVWLQVWSESFLMILLSVLSGSGIALLLMNKFNQLFGANIDASLFLNPVVLFSLLLLTFLISLIASGYPSVLMARLKTTEVLKGKLSVKRKGLLRNALIVVQFVIAVVLICATLIIYRQFQHLRKAPLGYNKDALVSVPIKGTENGHAVVTKMRTLLSAQSSVESISASSVNLGLGEDGSTSTTGFGFDFNGRTVFTNFMSADFDIVRTLGIPLKSGRDFSVEYASDTSNNVIVTESMAKQLGIGDPIGRKVLYDSSQAPWVIVGVIPDFQLYSMYNKRAPLTIGVNKASDSYLLIRINTKNPVATMDLIKKAYKEAEPGAEFRGSFVSENVDRWYRSEQQLSRMFTVAAVIAVVLSCMGLFGMAFIIVGQRTREIGVRKMLGASVSSIAMLVSREFIQPVFIAIIIATPIALWVLNKWLQHFTYRVPVTWWVFAVAGMTALCIAIITVSAQAIKAAYTNPVETLRTE
ncbi:hypothetical protein A8C56_11110 [Niabella ginsenosidivorans]|uniref:ABC transporter permease n=1 Tax=Niabella ginsenosidivorans TaxID=1176587 RepID=A0A1A9I2A1_9BACT|nr:ABC transporter permease [Niabella ginsenosidivorans]ANH81455.1 hypothetical protein A8C56_11110 [Niabella ginsenosidivorans]